MLSKYCYTWCEVEKPMFKFDRGFYNVENACAMDFYITYFRVCDPTNIVHENMFGFYKRFSCRRETGGVPFQRNLLTVIR